MSAYAVVKVERATGRIDAVMARGMSYWLADRMAADLRPRVQEGFYITARNEKDITDE